MNSQMRVPDLRLADVLNAAGVPDLIEILSERLSALELGAVLREASRRRTGRVEAPAVLAQYQRESYLHCRSIADGNTARIEQTARSLASPLFESVELSPICPIGAVSALGPVDPGAAWAAGGTCEVVSDARIMLAVEAASRRDAMSVGGTDSADSIHLCTSHRQLHAPFSAPLRHEHHARVFALATMGRDDGSCAFEFAALEEQLSIHLGTLALLRQGGLPLGSVTVACHVELRSPLFPLVRGGMVDTLCETFPDVRVALAHERRGGRGLVEFTVVVEDHAGVEHIVGMGGVTDWSRRLLDRDDECCLASMIATERMADAFRRERA